MKESRLKSEKGSVLVMAVVLSFAIILLGVSFLRSSLTLRDQIAWEIGQMLSDYDAFAGLREGLTDKTTGHPLQPGMRFYYGKAPDINYKGYDITYLGSDDIGYGVASNLYILGKGHSRYQGEDIYSEIGAAFQYETYADYLYITDKERDAWRHRIIRFWQPDTLDGKVHSNDTIHIQSNYDRPQFKKVVTTTAGYIDPPQNNVDFVEDWHWAKPIFFPDQATEIRYNAGWENGTQSTDSLVELTLDYNYIYYRKCGPFTDTSGQVVLRCYPSSIGAAPYFQIPPSGVIFIYGKCWVKASRGQLDRMDGEYPERSYIDGNFRSRGFHGRLTIGCSDTMIIPDNLIFYGARSNYSVPRSLDSCSDILGLVSENYIMIGAKTRSTVYVNAAMAAIKGSISVQDIYDSIPPGIDNEKQSLFIWGSLAQRNRGIVHTENPPGHLRGFREKDYHYDWRLQTNPPPHFLPARKSKLRFYVSIGPDGGG